ncbi:MAG: hypothetical protein ACLQVI_33515 [Polyangiaceae bacterium]
MAATHWTYAEDVRPEDDLSQGDYLAPTDKLREVLKQVHPHFCNEKYVGFVITTQTCDLARRGGGECTARYISIASVRTLYTVLPRLVASLEGAIVKDNVFRQSKKSKASELLDRVVDQNEQSLGLFYFHEDSELGIGDPCVAYLRVTVALKADHYAVLVAARRGRLKPDFQAKFGWLVGNLYARPATTDWAEQPNGDAAKREVINRLLRSESIQWVEDKALEMLADEKADYKSLSAADLVNEVRKKKPKRLLDEVVDVVAEVASRHAATMLEARRKTFDHHVHKLTRWPNEPAKGGLEPEPPLEAPASAEQSPTDKIDAIAKEHLCKDFSAKESDQLKRTLKSETRLKQLLK